MYEQIPEELKSLPQWVGFFRTPGKNGKTTKIPVNVRTLYGANSTNPETWGTYEQAVEAIGKTAIVRDSSGEIEGIGFVLAPPYCGIDLDNVVDYDTGEINPEALDIVENMRSYTELSPSKTGLHIIYKGKIHPEWKCKRGNALGKDTDIEMYQQGRYFTITGNIWGNVRKIEERDGIAELIQKIYMQPEKKVRKNEQPVVQEIKLSDSDILSLARNSRNGTLFSELFAGNWQGRYSSQSEADMAFCSMLAFWFGCDFERMDNIFRKSGLMREKWDRKQSGSTYGALTLNKAINECTKAYTPSVPDNGDFSVEIKNRKYYSFDDMGNAQRLIDMFGDKIRYNYNDKRWMIYNRNKWEYDITGFLPNLIDKAVEEMKHEAKYYEEYDAENGTELLSAFEKHMKKCRNNNSKTALEKEARHYVAITPNALDRHKLLLNTPAGIIDLISFEVMPNDPLKYFTKSTAVSYTKGMECPLWFKFLDEIFAGDKEVIHYVQKAVGYSLSGLTDEQCAFFLYGSGRNGKSTFIDIIREIFGDYASNIQPETLMIKNAGGSANSDIARLKGTRIVTSVEPNEGMRLNEGLLKQLTGDDVVTARKLYGDEFEFKPEFKLWMTTNHKPIIRGTDTGIWRRIHLIPFTVQIPENKVDRKLKEKLLEELDGIFLWCLEGLKMYNSEGLTKPSSVIQAVEQYKGEMDTVSKFLDECTVPAQMKYIKANELYSVYSRWCESNGEYKMTNTKFGMEVTKRYERKHLSIGNVYIGLDFTEEYKPYDISINNTL